MGPDADQRLSVELLMSQLVEQASLIMTAQERLRRLLTANRSIVQELSLPAVLHRIVGTARDVANARYAALGVIGADGLLEQFLHVGVDEETAQVIGELPKGRGVLGALIEDPQPIRLTRIADDPRSSGFPDGHPPMTTYLHPFGNATGLGYACDGASCSGWLHAPDGCQCLRAGGRVKGRVTPAERRRRRP
jgi:hypothetical protein